MDLCATKGAYLVGLDEEHIAKLKEINGAYTECLIPGGNDQIRNRDDVIVVTTLHDIGQLSDIFER